MASSGAKPNVLHSAPEGGERLVNLTKQTGNRKREKAKRAHSPILALPLHRISTRADGHMGDATFFKESEVDS